MNKTVIVNLIWPTEESGGRKHIFPKGMRYSPIAIVDGGENLDSQWGVFVTNISIEGRVSVAEMSYVMENAPHHLLVPGATVVLYDGPRVIADGVIQ